MGRIIIAIQARRAGKPPSEIGVSMTRFGRIVQQAIGDEMRAAIDADVFAQQDDRLVALHLIGHRRAQRLAIGHDGHGALRGDGVMG